ncbi:MAG: hypothetical protein ACRDOH_18855 [Streptosporangiaceae bacterium]
MLFLTYVRRQLRHRLRQAVLIGAGLAVAAGLVITISAASASVKNTHAGPAATTAQTRSRPARAGLAVPCRVPAGQGSQVPVTARHSSPVPLPARHGSQVPARGCQVPAPAK